MHHPTYRITHTTAFVTPVVEHWPNSAKEGSVLFNDALNTFYLRLYDAGYMYINKFINWKYLRNGFFTFVQLREEEGNVLFNDTLNTFSIYGYMAYGKGPSDSEVGNPLPPRDIPQT